MKLSILPLAYCASLVLLATETQARVQDVQSVEQWTKDQARAYLDKYHISYDKSAEDEKLLNTAKKYRDAAVANTHIFINNKTDIVNKLMDAVKLKLTHSYKLSTENANSLANDIQHSLKQLELRGDLTREQVKRSLDKLEHKTTKQKILTGSQFKELALDIEENFISPGWYRRLFGPSTSDMFPEDSYHTWVKDHVQTRLENRGLTKEQTTGVIDSLKQAISSTGRELHKLGDTDWWNKLSGEIQQNAKITKEQTQEVVDSLQDEVTAYKVSAMDYAGERLDEAKGLVWRLKDYVVDTASSLYRTWAGPQQIKDASVMRTTQAATKGSLGHYWRQKQLESYRALGYTDAHVEWIQNYLSKTLNDKKDLTRDSVTHAIRTIRQYLVQTKVQTSAHIDAHLKSLEELIEYWTRHGHDEL